MNQRTCVVLASVLVAACGGDPADQPVADRPTPTGPSVLLISIDTLRADHLSAYGYQRATSPMIDALAAEGVLFENHISSTSWTLPAHAAMFSSLPDSVHGCTDTDRVLADGVTTLAEQFYQVGYRTAGFFAGPYLHPAFGLSQGFETYENCTSYANRIDDSPVDTWAMSQDVMQASHRDVTNPIVVGAFRDWLDDNGSAPFFAFVHLWDTHFDFIPPAPYDSMFDPDYEGSVSGENFFFDPAIGPEMDPRDLEHLIALYDGEIAWTDDHVGQILEALREAAMLDDTVIAITSDHGTEFFEHGNKGHRTTLFDELIRVPLILRYPAALPAGVRVTAQTRSIDVAPTLLALAGAPALPAALGSSLVGLSAGGEPSFDNAAVSELFSVGQRVRTLRTQEWKIFDVMHLRRRFIVDLLADPAERGLRPFAPDEATLMQRYLDASTELAMHRDALALGDDAATIPEDVLEQLRALGYIQN